MKIANLLRRAAAMLLAVLIPASSMPVLALSGGTNVTTTPAQQFCGATIRLSGSDYLCAVDLGAPVIDSGSDTAMTAGTTVRLDLFFSINDSWYACRKQEMQGDPNTLFTVRFIRDQGADRVSDPVWKTYPDDGYGERYYLEFTVIGGDTDAPVDVSIALTQPDASNVGAQYRITGTSAAYGTCTAEFDLPGYSGPCDVYLGDPVTSTGDPAAMVPGSTVCFPLMFLGGDGELYAAYSTEMRGDPNDLFTVEGSGEPLLTCSGWKTWENHHWYLEYTVGQGEPGDLLALRVRLRQSEAYKATPWKPFDGGMGQKGPCVAPISIGGTVYDCTVDLQNAVTSTGDDQNMTAGSTVCFPLVFLADDGSWYPVLRDELQGEPDGLFALSETISSGEALLTRTGWKTWPSGQYYLEYEVADSQYETPLCLSVRLKQDAAYRQGTAVAFSGTAPASDDPVWKQCTAPISINGEIYDCVVDLRGYLTSTGGETLEDGSTVCFPLMFLGGDGAWYPVLRDELQGDPAELFTVAPKFTSGSASFVGWETWENGHYYAAFKVSAEQTEMELDFTAQLKQGDERCGTPVVFHGSVAAKQIYCSVPIKLGDTVYPCLADFGNPVTSVGGTDLEGRNTVCFPLVFMGGDGKWYPILASELQGTLEQLLTVKETFTAGGQWFGKPVWKHDWPNGAYYLEYTLQDPDEKQDIEISVRLSDGTTTTAAKTFTGTLSSRSGRYVEWARRLVEENPAGQNQGKVVLVGTSHVDYWDNYATHMAPLDTLNFGLAGAFIQNLVDTKDICVTPYAPRAVVIVVGGNDIRVDNADADTVCAAMTDYVKSVMEDLPGTPVFVVSQIEAPVDTESHKQTKSAVNERMKALCDETANLYYIDVTVGVNPEDEAERAALFRDDGIHLNNRGYDIFGPIIARAVCEVLGVEPDNPLQQPCSVPIKIGDTVYDCVVDLRGYLTSTGGETLKDGSTVCFPLMFLGGDGAWYPVLRDELQGDPAKLFTVAPEFTSGSASFVGWETWENGHYYAAFKVSAEQTEMELDFAAQLQQGDERCGTPVVFHGSVAAKQIYCSVPIKLGDTVYPCLADFGAPLTSTGGTDLEGTNTIAFPLQFLGGDGKWYPVLASELQGEPEMLLEIQQTITSGAQWFGKPVWKHDWPNGAYYLEYKMLDPDEKQKIEVSVQLFDGTNTTLPQTFTGTLSSRAGRYVQWAKQIAEGNPAQENQGKVVLIGDSHVEYWADYAYHMAPLEALDFGMGGAIIQTLADTREILTTPYAPRAVVVVAGCNDVMLFDADADTVYTALSGYLKDVLKDLPDTPVFAVSQMVNLTDTESRKQTKLEVNERIKALCDATQNLYYIDVTPGVNPDDPDEMAALLRDDGVHLNQKGYDIFGPTIADAVRKVLDVEPTDPPQRQCSVPIKIGDTVYDCTVDLQGYLTSSGSDVLAGGGTVAFPLMFLGGDGVWYPVLKGELQGNPDDLFYVEGTIDAGGTLLKKTGWKTWDTGHYYLEYAIADAKKTENVAFSVQLCQTGNRAGVPVAFRGTVPGSASETETPPAQNTSCVVPIKIDGVVYDCTVDLQGYLTSSGTDILAGGGTVAFPLMFLGGDGEWYPVLKNELQGTPESILSVKQTIVLGGKLLTRTGWKTWDNGHWYLEYTVAGAEKDAKVEFSVRLCQSGGKAGTPVTFRGTVPGTAPGTDEPPVEENTSCIVPIKIDGTVYDCIVDLQGSLTSSGSETLAGGGTVAFPLMFLGGDGEWYPVLRDELQGDPADLFTHTMNARSGGELLTCTGWGCWDNGHYYLEYKVSAPRETARLEFGVILERNGASGAEDLFTGYVQPGPDLSDRQIPLKPSASLVVERVEECQDFNTMSFTISGVRYEDGWPIDFESPNTTSAVITDGTIIRSDLCFMVNGQWYPVRQQECNESIEDLLTYDYQVLSGGEFLTTPRFTTRYDAYGDIWQFEVAVSSEKEGEFSFTLQLKSKDGTKTGSKYKVTGRVQNGQMTSSVEELPEESGGSWLWLAIGGSCAVVAAAGVTVFFLLRRKKKI